MPEYSLETIKMAITIVKRGMGNKFVDYFKKMKLHYNFLCLGTGTASSEILDCLGLEKTDKDVIITMLPCSKISAVLKGAEEKFHISAPGGGILFTIPLTSVSARIPQILCKDSKTEIKTESGDKALENNRKFDLILTVVTRGNEERVMNAAKSAGAKGGTIVHARRVGFEDVANLFGFTIQPEKDIIAILTPKEMKHAIMESITKEAGISTECRALVFSLPVDEIIGI